jgi:hypothetical protein
MIEVPRRFPAPWRADKMPGGYVVSDANWQAVAYLYSRDNEDEARQAKTLTANEARRIASTLRGCRSQLRRSSPETKHGLPAAVGAPYTRSMG